MYGLSLNDHADRAYQNSRGHGFWNGQDPGDVTIRLSKLALITEEVGEAISAVRSADDANLAEELADICIRVMDLSMACGINLEQAIVDKMEINSGRPYMHGKLA